MQFNDLVVRLAADWLVVPMALVTVVALLRLPRKQRYLAFGRAVVLLLLSLLLAKIASLFYVGVRPFEALGITPGASYLDNPGFPSDHALLVIGMTIIVWVVTKNKQLAIVMGCMALLVMLARIAAFVHTPVDVIGGALCAILAGLAVYGRPLLKRT